MKCNYDEPYCGRCKHEADECSQHSKLKCWCGARAVRGCCAAWSFVCGQPLCADHKCHLVAQGLTGSPGACHSKEGRAQYDEFTARDNKS